MITLTRLRDLLTDARVARSRSKTAPRAVRERLDEDIAILEELIALRERGAIWGEA